MIRKYFRYNYLSNKKILFNKIDMKDDWYLDY